MVGLIDVPKGLNGVAVADTNIGDVRGDEGYYHYRGRSAVDLAERATFGEVAALVMGVPLDGDRTLPDGVVLTRGIRTALSSLGAALECRPVLDLTPSERKREVVQFCSKVPTLIASLHHGELVQPNASLTSPVDFLRMLTGSAPQPSAARALEQYLILVLDHGFNASAFTARVIASTGADVGACMTGAFGALNGPLHGGAPSRVLDMLDEIGDAANVGGWVRAELDRGRRLMGFGHAVYRADDPRHVLLRRIAAELGGPRVELALEVERVATEELARRHATRRLVPNVELFGAIVMEACGIPRHLMTATFASSRAVGWGAHVLEQAEEAKLIRPAARYVGAT